MEILFISYNHNDKKLADAIQNQRLTAVLSKFYSIEVISRREEKGLLQALLRISSFGDKCIFKFAPYFRQLFSLELSLFSFFEYFRIKKSKKQCDLIITTHEPYTSRFLGFALKKLYNCKLVSVLYDPCYENVFFSQSEIAFKSRLKVETSICSYSDVIVLNSQLVYQSFVKRHPYSSIRIIPFISDICLIHNGSVSRSGKLKIVHGGNIHGRRNLKGLIQVVRILKNRNPNIVNDLSIELYGQCWPNDLNRLKDSGCNDVIIYKGFCNQEELKCHLINSDVLLLIDPVDCQNYSFPSKLCEYFIYQKPIIGYTSKESVSYNILKDAGQFAFSETETNDMADCILYLLINRDKIQSIGVNSYYKNFLPITIANQYKEIFDAL